MTKLTVQPAVAIAIAAVILAPLSVIWALNTLFALGIAYNFWTWLAVLVLTAAFGNGNVKRNK